MSAAPVPRSTPAPAAPCPGRRPSPPARAFSRLRGALRAFADHWLPRECALCACPLAGDAPGVCTSCAHALPGRHAPRCRRCGANAATRSPDHCPACSGQPGGPDRTIVLADYAPPLDRLVVALKFRGELAAAAPLGRLLAESLAAADVPRPDLVVAVPLSPERLAARGYDQALAIARALGRAARLPVDSRILARMRDTPAQSGLDRNARLDNLRDAFTARRRVDGRAIAVVDDVMTTGATARAAADTLADAGARFVIHLAAARTP